MGTHARVALLELPAGHGEARATALAAENATSLNDLCSKTGWSIERVPFPDTSNRRTAGQVVSRQLQSGGLIDPNGVVIVDISALPTYMAFPVIGGVLAATDSGAFHGDLLTLVCENPEIDLCIVEEGAFDPGPVAGFNFGITESTRTTIRVWAPVLGEGQAEQLEAIHGYLDPDEITPILPFPAANPRRADDLIVELRSLLFDRMAVEPGNFIYAHEANPFDVYRSLWHLSDRLQRALEPLGGATVTTSLHGSKMLSMGALLASWERKLPVVAAVPTDYAITAGVDLASLTNRNRLACLWLVGEPYR